MRSLSVEELNARLDERFRLLTDGSRTALPRHQTLRALIDWSYDLLTEVEQTLLQRLSVFSGGWTLEAAEQICAGEGIEEWEVVDLLTSLTDKSLAVAVEQEGKTRYHFLETVRQYATEKLTTSGRMEALRRRHQNYYLQWAEGIGTWRTQPPNAVRLEIEHDNLRGALDYCHKTQESAEAGLRLVNSLFEFWDTCGYPGEAKEQIARALAHVNIARSPAWWDVYLLQQHTMGGREAVRILKEECLPAYKQANDTLGEVLALYTLARAYFDMDEYEDSFNYTEQGLLLCRAIDHRRWLPSLVCQSGLVAYSRKDYATALTRFEEAYALDLERGQHYGMAHVRIGFAALLLGRNVYAETVFRECIPLYAVGGKSLLPMLFSGLSRAAAAQGRWERAAHLYGVEEQQKLTLFGRPNDAPSPSKAAYISTMKTELGSEAFEAAVAAGRALPPELAVVYALEEHNAGLFAQRTGKV
jgi:non-specific serine/threonine protein kinase